MRAGIVIVALVGVACSSSYGAGETPSDAGGGGEAATPATCVASLEQGWSPVAAAETGSAACAATQAQLELVSEPIAGGDACACECNVRRPASCAVGVLTFLTGSSTACENPSAFYEIEDTSTCAPRGFSTTIAGGAQVNPMPSRKAECAPALEAKPEAVTTTMRRLCLPSGESVESTCRGEVAVGFASCIVHEGDVGCPNGPFARRILAGDRAALACSGCTSCATTLSCTSPLIRYYDDAACATQVGTRPVTGECEQPTSGSGATFSYLRYDATMTSTCTTGPPATATITLEGPKTICCR